MYTKFRVNCLGLAFCCILLSCKSGNDVTGMWHGSMSVPDRSNGGSADVNAALQQTNHAVTGNITWHHPKGPWSALGDATFVVTSGVVTGDKVSITAVDDLEGGKVTLTLTGDAGASNVKGNLSISVSSVGGGGTLPGTFELSKD